MAGERDAGADIVRRDVVIAGDVVDAVAGSQGSQNDAHGSARASDHRLAVTTIRVNFNARVHVPIARMAG